MVTKNNCLPPLSAPVFYLDPDLTLGLPACLEQKSALCIDSVGTLLTSFLVSLGCAATGQLERWHVTA